MAESNANGAAHLGSPSTTQPTAPATTSTPPPPGPTTAANSTLHLPYPRLHTDKPLTSLMDNGTTTRPRDARTIHLLLSSMGVTAYQERVPLQLLDFAYRYTSGVLCDAQHLAAEGYTVGNMNPGPAARAAADGGRAGVGEVNMAALRLAATARMGYQFSGTLPKETMLELAAERNRVRLPAVDRDGAVSGVRLPYERFVLSGVGWGLPEEWDSEVDEEGGEKGEEPDGGRAEDGVMVNGGGGGEQVEDEDMEDDGDGFEHIFGNDEGGDEVMEDG